MPAPISLPSAQPARERLASPWFSAGLLIGTLAAFVFLFPKANLNRQLANGHNVSAATLIYLTLMTRASPSDVALHTLLARKALQVGDLALARRALEPWPEASTDTPASVALLRLDILRAALLAAKPGTAARQQAITRYRAGVLQTAHRLSTSELLVQAHISLGFGLYETAAELSDAALVRATTPGDKLRALHLGINSLLASGDPKAALRFAVRQARHIPDEAALWHSLFQLGMQAGEPLEATDYARRWFRLANSPVERRQAFDGLIHAYLAAGKPGEALDLAGALLPDIVPDRSLWRRLTRLALAADRPHLAARYARRLVGLPEPRP